MSGERKPNRVENTGYLPRLLFESPPARRLLRPTLKLIDVSALLVAFLAAALLLALRSHVASLEEFFALRLSIANVAILLGLLLFWHAGFSAFGLYDEGRPLLAPGRAVDVFKATTCGILAVSACAIFFDIGIVDALFFLAFAAAAYACVFGARGLLSVAMQLVPRRYVLIAGTGEPAQRFARELETHGEGHGYVVGFVAEPPPDASSACGRVACDLEKFPAFLSENVIDEVVIALSLRVLNEHRTRLMAACSQHGVTVRFLSSVLIDPDDLGSGAASDQVVMTLYHAPIEGLPLVMKRVTDLLGSSILLVLLAPFMLVTGLAIRLTSRGPALFTQERIGFGKRRIRMLKFRTMEAEAEARLPEFEHLNQVDGAAFKLHDDPRVTRVGRFLRATSIDELPQLVNVVKGDMSLVGPRPLPVRDFERFASDHHKRRFSVRPGMTGLWQVSGRSSTSFDRWMELDLRYIDEWSLGLDLRILLQTIPAVLRRDGAE